MSPPSLAMAGWISLMTLLPGCTATQLLSRLNDYERTELAPLQFRHWHPPVRFPIKPVGPASS